MKKNSQIHIFLETELREKLMNQANEEGISLSELCRLKLKDNSQLTKIEFMLEQIQKSILDNRGLYKAKDLQEININNKVPLNHSKT